MISASLIERHPNNNIFIIRSICVGDPDGIAAAGILGVCGAAINLIVLHTRALHIAVDNFFFEHAAGERFPDGFIRPGFVWQVDDLIPAEDDNKEFLGRLVGDLVPALIRVGSRAVHWWQDELLIFGHVVLTVINARIRKHNQAVLSFFLINNVKEAILVSGHSEPQLNTSVKDGSQARFARRVSRPLDYYAILHRQQRRQLGLRAHSVFWTRLIDVLRFGLSLDLRRLISGSRILLRTARSSVHHDENRKQAEESRNATKTNGSELHLLCTSENVEQAASLFRFFRSAMEQAGSLFYLNPPRKLFL